MAASFHMKPGQLANLLGWERLELVFAHPANYRNFERVKGLITQLRSCTMPGDYYVFQRQLFQFVYEADQRRGQCTRALIRLKSGKSADAPAPPKIIPDEVDSWRLEEYVYERIGRQLRSVGDALAWRSYGYDRRAILTLSRNSPIGTMNLKKGLDYETGMVDKLWKESNNFALLHDLTNCLRMGDVTEFTPDGGAFLHEVKSDPSRKSKQQKEQMKRIQKAIDALMDDGKLPGHQADAKLIELETIYQTDLAKLEDLLGLAQKYGFRGMKLSGGRALMAFSLDDTFRIYGTNTEEGMKKHAETRKRVIKRAGIADATHHMNGISSDTASRSPIIAPWAIYPFSDEVCAALTCDFMSFETIISADALAEQLRGPGLDVAIELPNEHGTPVGSEQNVFRVKWRNRTLTVHGGGMNTLFYELLLPHVWAQGVYELLTGNDDPPQSPVTVFGKEYTTWWQ